MVEEVEVFSFLSAITMPAAYIIVVKCDLIFQSFSDKTIYAVVTRDGSAGRDEKDLSAT